MIYWNINDLIIWYDNFNITINRNFQYFEWINDLNNLNDLLYKLEFSFILYRFDNNFY